MKVSDSINPHSLPSNKLRAFWVLDKLETQANDRLGASSIAKYLVENHGIKTSPQAIKYALQSGKRSTHKDAKGYKLMELGRQELWATQKQETVVMIEAGKPFSAKNIELKKLFSSFASAVHISDPYLDINTLDIIFKVVDKSICIKILTNHVVDKPTGVFGRHLSELRKEGYQIEVGVYSSTDLHDRYIMDDSVFWLSGNSLNHLGDKESFIVRLGEDVRQSMMATFNNRWKIANKL